MIKAIETHYAGCAFRSRLEARWAVFFDALGIEWMYEPEGFETPAGRYLPDFYLPGTHAWIEVKGGTFTKRDHDRAAHVAEAKWCERGDKFRVLIGDLPRHGPAIPILSWVQELLPVPTDGKTHIDWRDTIPFPRYWSRGSWIPSGTGPQVDRALLAARSARFGT